MFYPPLAPMSYHYPLDTLGSTAALFYTFGTDTTQSYANSLKIRYNHFYIENTRDMQYHYATIHLDMLQVLLETRIHPQKSLILDVA